ncbi:MAG: ribosomal protein S18-alanine N-acetyltransferase [Aquabacterium sp.]|nr:ribosomal protein S18-alanine N-acetyltransferase [Aquabacterium sp.]
MAAMVDASRPEPSSPAREAHAADDGIAHRPMVLADLDVVLDIEARAYSHPWSRGNFVDSLLSGYAAELRLDARGRCLAYCVAMPGVQEMHLLNLTVDPACQRRGHGRALLRRLMQASQRRGDGVLWLEVRASNQAALALYLAEGFLRAGLRKGYYPSGGDQREDAVVMSRALAGGHHAVD